MKWFNMLLTGDEGVLEELVAYVYNKV